MEFGKDVDSCFKTFDKDEDGFLNENEFGALCRALFRNEKDEPYPLEATMLASLFAIFDINKDNLIDKEEFQFCWQKWIKPIVRPVSALLVVDVQNDFISGSLPVCKMPAGHKGEEVIPPINKMLSEINFDAVVYTLDLHPSDHMSFIDNVHKWPIHQSSKISAKDAKVYDTVIFDIKNRKREQTLWPVHCLEGSWGVEVHKDLKMVENALFIKKGINSDADSYSAFWDNNKNWKSNLDDELKKRNVTDVYCCGIAFDICVGSTAKHANEIGYRTVMIEDACRGVNNDGIRETKDNITSNHGMIVNSSQVKDLVTGQDRPAVLGYKLSLELSKN